MDSQTDIDPRVQIELEVLNQSATDINRLEKEIDEARSKYQSTFSACSQQLEVLKKKFGASIKRARPYYEIKEAAREAQSEALRSARQFQTANGVYLAAKETISLAELRLMDDKAACLSPAWQEMLNHALLRVTEAEKDKSTSEKEHLKRSAVYADMESKLQLLEKKHKRSIAKARSYFDTKKELELKLQQVKQSVEDLQKAMRSSKKRYSDALRHLEQISDGIHEKRRQELILMFPREPGVGAEENSVMSEQENHLPSLSSSYDVDCQDGLLDYDDDDDDVYYDESDEGNDGYTDINNESVFRAKVLAASLDDEDTSFMQKKGSRRRRRNKPLKRTQSLPVYTCHKPSRDSPSSPQQGSLGSGTSSIEDVFGKPLMPLSDRADTSPPDGDSLSSEKNIAYAADPSDSKNSDNSNDNISENTSSLPEPHLPKICDMTDSCEQHTESGKMPSGRDIKPSGSEMTNNNDSVVDISSQNTTETDTSSGQQSELQADNDGQIAENGDQTAQENDSEAPNRETNSESTEAVEAIISEDDINLEGYTPDDDARSASSTNVDVKPTPKPRNTITSQEVSAQSTQAD